MSVEKRSGYINVDDLMPQVTLEQAAAYYGVPLPELHRTGDEIRTRCFLNCGAGCRTGDRALAIKANDPVKRWRCHQYGCGKGGNLVSLCDLMKPGPHTDGRPRGERFKEIAADLRAMVEGVAHSHTPKAPPPTAAAEAEVEAPKVNLPLARSPIERARSLVMLDEKLITDPGQMSPDAAGYFRRRPFLSSEVCKKWRIGYLPANAGEDRSGGTMRGRIVYPILSERGEVLTWFGRDPEWEVKHAAWLSKGGVGREPEKFHFVKGFHRGLELFGQHASRLQEPGYRKQIARLGVIVVEGPNDVISLDALGVPAVGACSNTITEGQVQKLARWAKQLSGGVVTVMFDCDEEGEKGAKQALALLAEHCRVRLAWSPVAWNGRFRNRQPESLTAEEWEMLHAHLSQ